VACELLIECRVYSPSSLNKFCTPGPWPQALFGDELQAAAAVAAVESEAESNTVTTTIRLRQWFEAETSETSSCSPPYSDTECQPSVYKVVWQNILDGNINR
jgi:hypothetical protein